MNRSAQLIYDPPRDRVRQSILSATHQPAAAYRAEPLATTLIEPRPPSWVCDLIPGAGDTIDSSSVRAVRAGSLVWLAAHVPGAGNLAPDALRSRVAHVYTDLGRALVDNRAVALRLWNYLPNPAAIVAPGLDRYMVFNAGRYDGYGKWFPHGGFERAMPTATAIGVASDDLTVHCLASATPGRPVQNPRQRLPWKYSARYGPLPPTFSRGTVAVLNERPVLLIGGTASIVGEDSMHVGDIDAQLHETLNNLAVVVAQALDGDEPRERALARMTHLRAYVPRVQDAAIVHAELQTCCAPTVHIEMMVARLCRPELLVEIEGVAAL